MEAGGGGGGCLTSQSPPQAAAVKLGLKITRFRQEGDVKNKKPSEISSERILDPGHKQIRGSQGTMALAQV